MSVKFSSGNSKMGEIPSVSLPAGITCRGDCECRKICYALKLSRFRPSVKESYQHNWTLLQCSPNTYWREVEGKIMMSRFFRFHVSGDIPDDGYFARMVGVARRNPHCQILCFTKKYDIVNRYLERCAVAGEPLPQNLRVIFSAWRNLEMNNPYRLPEAHVLYNDGSTTARPGARKCSGNCSECAMTDGGCWSLSCGEQVVFHQH